MSITLSKVTTNKNKMCHAYVLLNVSTGSEKQVLIDTKKIKNVKEAHLCFGVYDLILKVETPSMKKMRVLVTHKLRKIKHITSTLSLFYSSDKDLEKFVAKPYTSFF